MNNLPQIAAPQRSRGNRGGYQSINNITPPPKGVLNNAASKVRNFGKKQFIAGAKNAGTLSGNTRAGVGIALGGVQGKHLATAGAVGLGAAALYGGKKLLDRRREKTASLWREVIMTNEEMEILFQQGLEKIASESDENYVPPRYEGHPFTRLNKTWQREGGDGVGRFALNLGGVGLGGAVLGAGAGLLSAKNPKEALQAAQGGAALGGSLGLLGGVGYQGVRDYKTQQRLIDKAYPDMPENERNKARLMSGLGGMMPAGTLDRAAARQEKTAAAYGLKPEEMEYLIEQGLEKIAAETADPEFEESLVKVASHLGMDPEYMAEALVSHRDELIKVAEVEEYISTLDDDEVDELLKEAAANNSELAAIIASTEQEQENEELAKLAEMVDDLTDEEAEQLLASIQEKKEG